MDVLLLAFLESAAHEDDQVVAILAEINPAPWTNIKTQDDIGLRHHRIGIKWAKCHLAPRRPMEFALPLHAFAHRMKTPLFNLLM
jgi:hypothetical protein